ncbi:MAG: hypothetical protein ACK4YU_12880 [Paracoccus sp. (in: a-proteobacteria)]
MPTKRQPTPIKLVRALMGVAAQNLARQEPDGKPQDAQNKDRNGEQLDYDNDPFQPDGSARKMIFEIQNDSAPLLAPTDSADRCSVLRQTSPGASDSNDRARSSG